jgi:uncharacterized SAM-binding protein YcdF (DUF218 family)
MTVFLLAGGIICGVYYLVLIGFSGLRASFSLFWLALSLLFFAGFALLKISRHFPGRWKMPLSGKVFLITSLILMLGLFLLVESCIVRGMARREPDHDPRYLIVLGAKVRGDTVSKALKQRLDAAAEYWKEHPQTVLIVSGGQGPGENVTEAEAMYEYLIEAGVARGRVVKEDRSVNTVENLTNSLAILANTDAAVAVVTSDFHLYRAMRIAQTLTDKEISGIASPTDLWALPNYMVREFFAVLKDWFFGKI